MTATLLPNARQQFLDSNGRPLAGGSVSFFIPNTSTPKATWQDAGKTILNTNPVVLDSSGQAIIYGEGQYRQIVNDVHGNLIWDRLTDSYALNSEFQSFVSSIGASTGSSLIGFIQSGVGAVARSVQDELRDHFNVKQFGAKGDGATDDTIAIQAAINAASNSMHREIYFPAGKYNYTKLYCYYDAVLNPAYNVNRNGELTFTGDGISPENGGSCGTILYTTITSGDALNVGSAANDVVPYNTRDFIARDISFEGATSGTLVLARGVVSARFEGCQFVQSNIAGTALWGTTNYFGVVEKCRFQNRASGTPTGDAIKFGTTISAGLFTLRDCNISGFANSLNMYSGQWQLLNIESSELSCTAYGVYVNGETQILNLSGTYFEGTCTSFIADTANNKIKNLNMFGCWALGSGLSGPAVNLNAPNSVQIIGGYSQDHF